MASIILELQELASNPDSNVEELLNKMYMVARKLKLEELCKWCELELKGYAATNNLNSIPHYRKFHGELRAFNQQIGYIPLTLGNNEVMHMLTLIEQHEPICNLSNAINSESDFLEWPLPNDIKSEIKKMVNPPFPIEPKVVFHKTSLKNILSQIRQIILDWALKLEEQGILGEGIQFSEKEKEKAVTTHFNIQNMQGVVGNISGGNMQQNIYDGIHVEANNFDSLAKILSKNGIPFSELNLLKEAIDADEPPTEANRFGEHVSAWIGNIMKKVSSRTIDISLSTAAGLLTNAISKYYGLM